MANESATNGRVRMEIDLEPVVMSGEATGRLGFDREAARRAQRQNVATSFVGIPANATDGRMIPWYASANNEPDYLVHLAKENPILIGLLTTMASIAYGRGLSLMRDGQPVPLDQWPDEVRDFYERTDMDAIVYDLFFSQYILGNGFAQIIFNRGSRLAEVPKRIVDLYHISPETVRAALPRDTGDPIRHYYISPTWAKELGKNLTVPKVRAFNRRDFYDADGQFSREVGFASVLWHFKRRIPGFPHYAPPRWYGGRRTIELHNHIPTWHISNIINLFGARVVVYVSEDYLRTMMNETNPATKNPYTRNEVKKIISDKVRDHMTNPENVGRTIVLEHGFDHQGKQVKHVTIETVNLEVKDESYIGLIDKLNEAVTSGTGVDPSIAGIILQGKLSSGSEKRNAWNLEMMKAFFEQKQLLKLPTFIHRFNEWPAEYTWGFVPHPAMVTASVNPSGMDDDPETDEPPTP